MRREVRWFCGCIAGLLCGGYAMAQLNAGFAKTDITPDEPVRLGGYELRKSLSDGVYPGEKLYLRALVLESGAARIVFLEADIIMFRDHDSWRSRISQDTGIPLDHILIGDVHNHAAPSPGLDGNANWTRQLEKSIVPTVKQAIAALRPVSVGTGQGRSRVAMNRRAMRPTDQDSFATYDENNRSQSFGEFNTDHPIKIHEFAGEMRLGANPGGPIDEAVQLVRIDDEKGQPYALMIHYACHGTSLGGRNSKISAEWMGRMQTYVEMQIPGVNTIYLQGASGDINPRVVGGLDGNPDSIETTHALGEEIGREVVRVYRSLAPEKVIVPRIRVVSREILLPRTYRELAANFRDPAVRVTTTAVRVGDMMWVTFPGELFNTIGKHVKAACPATVALIMGYTNGYVGYFPEQEAFAQGGYEPATSHLAPNAEQIYMREIKRLMMAFQ